MSAATELYAPGFEPDYDGDHEYSVPAPRRRHLSAVPVAVPTDLTPVPARPALRPERVIRPGRPAGVAVLLPPERERPPLRLTRRGVVVLALAVAALGAVLVWVAALSAPSEAASGPASGGAVPAVVTVGAGDTLWSIAGRVAPGTDPRATVDRLRNLNHLADVALVPGQQLRVR